MSLLSPPLADRDHLRGSADARVTLVEYGDFECPACGEAYPVLREVRKAFGENLRFAFRHFPLVISHPHALVAAEAAEAAAAQGKFWPMHDRLFEHQDALDDRALTRHARKIGLDLDQFESALASRVYEARVREDLASGQASGLLGTPGLFINRVLYTGVRDRASLVAALAQAAVKAKVL